MVQSMDSYFRDNPPTQEALARWRRKLAAAWPYTEDDPEPSYFDWIPDPARSDATLAMELLKESGNWTEEDEKIAFDPSKPPPRPFEELEAEHDAFIERLMKDAKPL